jgi:two-component system, NtrC family, response regulator HydG
MNFAAGVNTGNEGIYWISRILKSGPSAVVVMITAYADGSLAVRATKEGATDFEDLFAQALSIKSGY